MKRILLIAAGSFIGIVAAVFAILSLSGPSTGWVRTETKDPMTDKISIEAVKLADAGGGRMGISCSNGAGPTLYFQAPVRLGGYAPEDNYQPRMVRYRFDSGPVEDTVGIFGDDMIGFGPKSDADPARWDTPILAGVAKAKTLAIDVTGQGSARVVMTFDVSGVDDVLRDLTKDCAAA